MKACLRARAGVSLLEVVVVIAILGVVTAIVGLSWRVDAPPNGHGTNSASTVIGSARRQALASAAPVTVRVKVGDEMVMLTAMPDGRVIGAERLGLDPLAAR